MKQANAGEASIDAGEVAKFERLADEWWDPNSKFRPLHKFNPVRLAYIREHAIAHFEKDPQARRPLQGLRILDIGCGGGLLCEPMARLGADVVGADPSRISIEAAKAHAARSNLEIDYRATTAEALRDAGESFDIVLNMEVIEHVADVTSFMTACCDLVRPNGLMVVATINRTAKAFALAIVGAEYILRWLPRGTHNYDKLVRPGEVAQKLSAGGMRAIDETGVTFNPLSDRWSRSDDMDVNYMILAHRPSER